MIYLGVIFSGYHENLGRGLRDRPAALLAAEIEVLPKLVSLMEKSETALANPVAPESWQQVTDMFDEALAQGKQPPATATKYPVTQM